MTIVNFIWDNQSQSVSWEYNGKKIERVYKNAYFATVNTQHNYVYIEAGQNYYQDQVYYLSFDGKRIFTLDKLSNKISWIYKGNIIEVTCENIIDAQLYSEDGIIIVIKEISKKLRKLQGFALDGTLLFEKESIYGYSFMNLSMCKSKPSVVCNGDKYNSDDYGRKSWHFVIDIKTGEMTKENLAY